MAYVLNNKGKPLMPTNRHGKVRHLLEDGKAKVGGIIMNEIKILNNTYEQEQKELIKLENLIKLYEGRTAKSDEQKIQEKEELEKIVKELNDGLNNIKKKDLEIAITNLKDNVKFIKGEIEESNFNNSKIIIEKIEEKLQSEKIIKEENSVKVLGTATGSGTNFDYIVSELVINDIKLNEKKIKIKGKKAIIQLYNNLKGIVVEKKAKATKDIFDTKEADEIIFQFFKPENIDIQKESFIVYDKELTQEEVEKEKNRIIGEFKTTIASEKKELVASKIINFILNAQKEKDEEALELVRNVFRKQVLLVTLGFGLRTNKGKVNIVKLLDDLGEVLGNVNTSFEEQKKKLEEYNDKLDEEVEEAEELNDKITYTTNVSGHVKNQEVFEHISKLLSITKDKKKIIKLKTILILLLDKNTAIKKYFNEDEFLNRCNSISDISGKITPEKLALIYGIENTSLPENYQEKIIDFKWEHPVENGIEYGEISIKTIDLIKFLIIMYMNVNKINQLYKTYDKLDEKFFDDLIDKKKDNYEMLGEIGSKLSIVLEQQKHLEKNK